LPKCLQEEIAKYFNGAESLSVWTDGYGLPVVISARYPLVITPLYKVLEEDDE